MAEPNVTTPVEAPSSGPEAGGAPAVPQGTTYDPDVYGLFPKTSLPDRFEGRFGDAVREANLYKQLQDSGLTEPGVQDFVDLARRQNMSPQEAYAYITATDQQAPGQAPAQLPAQSGYVQPPEQQPALNPDDQPITMAQFRQMREEDRTASQLADAKDKSDSAMHTEFDAVVETLRGFGFNMTADGQPGDSNATTAQQMLNGALNDVLKEDIPSWMGGDERKAALAGLSSTPSTAAQRQRAKVLFQERFTDFKQNAVVDFVKGQEGVPETLGAGPGGPVQKKFEDMSEKEIEEKVMSGVEQTIGHPITE